MKLTYVAMINTEKNTNFIVWNCVCETLGIIQSEVTYVYPKSNELPRKCKLAQKLSKDKFRNLLIFSSHAYIFAKGRKSKSKQILLPLGTVLLKGTDCRIDFAVWLSTNIALAVEGFLLEKALIWFLASLSAAYGPVSIFKSPAAPYGSAETNG